MNTPTSSASLVDTTDATRQEFATLLEAWAAAIVADDAEAIDRFVEPEWVIVGQNGVTPRERFLTAVASGDLSHSSMSFDMPDVRLYGDMAVVISHGYNTGTYKGQPFEFDEWVTDLFVRRGSQWRCVHTQLTPALADQPG